VYVTVLKFSPVRHVIKCVFITFSSETFYCYQSLKFFTQISYFKISLKLCCIHRDDVEVAIAYQRTCYIPEHFESEKVS